jgi:hypothetical protein
MGEEVADQAKTLVGRMRRRRQAEVDERQRRRRLELAQKLDRMHARLAGVHHVLGAQGEGERVGDERIVIDDEQRRLLLRRRLRARHRGCI